MKSTTKAIVGFAIVFLTLSRTAAHASSIDLSVEGGYGMLNTTDEGHAAWWAGAGYRLPNKTVVGLEGGYFATKEHRDDFANYSTSSGLNSAYVGPYAERSFDSTVFGVSLRGGVGASRLAQRAKVSYNGHEFINETVSDWYPALAVAADVHAKLTDRVRLGVGLREMIPFGRVEGTHDVAWLTWLMPFARLSVAF